MFIVLGRISCEICDRYCILVEYARKGLSGLSLMQVCWEWEICLWTYLAQMVLGLSARVCLVHLRNMMCCRFRLGGGACFLGRVGLLAYVIAMFLMRGIRDQSSLRRV